MFTERLQILVSPDQRRRLEHEARRRGTSVAAVIRDAVDGELGMVSPDERLRAVEAIGALRGEYLPPDELGALIDELHTAAILGTEPR
ncbi:MAG TPA: CopG family transcriptional regulator [Acidimicrobiales bacterium]|nr:CopG family transcriptional regulator [Acidimicrobiales bacterium]